MSEVDPIVQAFLEEADERLVELEEDLLRLEQNPSDNEIVHRIFRCAHTLKGNSRMLGFEEIARFTHSLEDLLDQLRKQLRAVTPEIVDTLLASGDVLKQLVGVSRGTDAPNPDVTEAVLHIIQGFLAGDGKPPVIELSSYSGSAPASFAPAPVAPAPVAPTPAPAAIETPSAPVANATPSASSASVAAASSAPAAAPLADDFFGLFEEGPPGALPNSTPVAKAASSATLAESPASAPSSATTAPTAVLPTTPMAATPMATTAPAKASAAKPTGGSAENASIRVTVEKVDRLINLVGELVITQSMIAQTVENFSTDKLASLAEAVAQMDRHARELHERMMAVRMVPIKSQFARFPRLVRDLAGMTGKLVQLETSGEDTELDKTVIERIADPLTHLLRNAVDHGLETPAERRAAGKRETATVTLKAYQRGGNIYIEVIDDGRGINRDKVRAKAIQVGLIPPDAQLTDDQINALIFKPGFSTAAQVTEVSGRGVGMDVVRKNVEALGGFISIKTELGRGTTFQIKLPLTLAIMDGQMMRVGDETYIVPLVSITESVRPAPGSLHAPAGSPPVVVIRDKVLPIIPLHRIFDITPTFTDPSQGLLVLVESDGRLSALLVDELLGQQQVVVKNLETNFKRTEGVAGATILGDGRVALILDIPGLVEIARSRECALAS